MRRAGVSNPWGKPRFLKLIVWGYIVWTIVPVLIAIQFGFNDGRSRTAWQGFSLRWYTGDPDLSVLHNPALFDALVQSVKLAGPNHGGRHAHRRAPCDRPVALGAVEDRNRPTS